MLIRRTAVGALGVTALVAGTFAAPATAFATPHHSDELKVKVCKKYDGSKHTKFRLNSWTEDDDSSSYNFGLRKNQCKKYTLDYDQNYYYLYEQNGTDYDVHYKVQGKKHWSSVDQYGTLTVKFKDHGKPNLKIWVYNFEDHHH